MAEQVKYNDKLHFMDGAQTNFAANMTVQTDGAGKLTVSTPIGTQKELISVKGALRGNISGADRRYDGIDGISYANTPGIIEWTGKLIRITANSDGVGTYDAAVYKNGVFLAKIVLTAESKKISAPLTAAVAVLDEIEVVIENITGTVANPRITATFKED